MTGDNNNLPLAPQRLLCLCGQIHYLITSYALSFMDYANRTDYYYSVTAEFVHRFLTFNAK